MYLPMSGAVTLQGPSIDAAWYLRSMLCDNAVRTMGVQYFVIIILLDTYNANDR